MGIYDRDYYREAPRRSFASLAMYSVTTWLIIINVAVYILDSLLAKSFPPSSRVAEHYLQLYHNRYYAEMLKKMSPLERFGHFSGFLGVHQLQVWRFITFQFLHASIGHLFGNMLSLYFFGQIVESYLTPRRYLVFYLLCGASGALVYLLMLAVHVMPGPSVVPADVTPLVGASAGIFGILIAASFVAPDATIMLLFPPIPMRLRVFALVMLGIAAFTVFTSGENAGGQAAHLGGALLGFILIRYPMLLDWVVPSRKVRGMRVRRVTKDWSKDPDR